MRWLPFTHRAHTCQNTFPPCPCCVRKFIIVYCQYHLYIMISYHNIHIYISQMYSHCFTVFKHFSVSCVEQSSHNDLLCSIHLTFSYIYIVGIIWSRRVPWSIVAWWMCCVKSSEVIVCSKTLQVAEKRLSLTSPSIMHCSSVDTFSCMCLESCSV